MPQLAACLVVLLTSAHVSAAGPVLRAGIGYSQMLETGDPDLDPVHYAGGGVDLFGGWELDFGLAFELQVGVHLFGGDQRARGFDLETLWIAIPVLAGARCSLALTDRFSAEATAHAGLVHQEWHRELLGVSGSGSGNYAGLNVSVGGDFVLDEWWSIGGAITYGVVFSRNEDVDESGNGHWLSIAARASLAL